MSGRWHRSSNPVARRGTGNTATPSGTGRAVRFASVMRSGCGPRSTSPRWHEPGRPSIGRHDFSAFGVVVEGRSPVRNVHAVRVGRKGRLVTIDVRANAFLRGMVRRMVAVLIEVGHGKMTETEVREALAARTPARNGVSAPARGLCLRRVVLGRRHGDGNDRRRRLRNDEHEDLHGPRKRDRAALVRRRRGGRDARPPRVAHRARARGQAQADVHAEPRFGRPRHRPQRRRGSPSRSNKRETKLYIRHSGHPQGYKEETLGHLLERRPEEVIRRAVKGMLPRNRLGVQQLRKLKVYAGTDHPHQAQQPEPLA